MTEQICNEHMEIFSTVDDMARFGHAPKQGCSVFDVGFEDTVNRISDAYLSSRFSRGRSAEKFIIGPFGSGKTHLLRLISKRALELDCVTSEVSLNQNIDFTSPATRYREIVRELRLPTSSEFGIRGLLHNCLDRRKASVSNAVVADEATAKWAETLETYFRLTEYGRVLKLTLIALLSNDSILAESGIRWLSGEFSAKSICADLHVSPVTKREEPNFALRAMLSLFQFIRYSGFAGTVVGYDEAEQGFYVSRRKMQEIQTMLQMEINAIADLEDASALILFVVTPNIIEKLVDFPALQQRLANPGKSFLEGADFAPQIDLSEQASLRDSNQHMKNIGRRNITILFADYSDPECPRCNSDYQVDQSTVAEFVDGIANKVSDEGLGAGEIRAFTKSSCGFLVHVWENDDSSGYTVRIDVDPTDDSDNAEF